MKDKSFKRKNKNNWTFERVKVILIKQELQQIADLIWRNKVNEVEKWLNEI